MGYELHAASPPPGSFRSSIHRLIQKLETLKIEDVERANRISPLGNANPEDLAHEVVHLFRKDIRITGEIRHVDGGFHIMG